MEGHHRLCGTSRRALLSEGLVLLRLLEETAFRGSLRAPHYSVSCLLCGRRHCSSIHRGRGWVTAGSIATQSQRACEAPKKMQGLFCKWEGKGDWEKRVSFSGMLLISLCRHWRMTCFCWVPRVAIQFPFVKLDSWYLMNETCHKTLAVPRNGSSWQR